MGRVKQGRRRKRPAPDRPQQAPAPAGGGNEPEPSGYRGTPSQRRSFASRLAALGVVIVGLILVILLYLRWGGEAGTFRGDTSSFNVLLLTLDTTRADRLGCYGFDGVRTPFIDGLARKGVLFENAYSPAVMTLPSHASIMSGLLPPEHGVRINASAQLRPEVETLAEVLRAAGYRTGAVVAAAVLDSVFGLAQGFEHYDENLPASGPHDAFFAQRAAGEVTDAALSWLQEIRDDRWLLWVHYYDPHAPLTPPSPFREQYGPRSYEGEIAYMDAEIGRLLAGVEGMGASGRTIVILVGDHGEGLGDHGEMSHGVFLYDETARVPLVITVPGFIDGPRRVAAVVRTTDIMPTVLDLLRLPARTQLARRSLWPLMTGRADDPELEAYLESSASALEYGWSPLAALRSGPWKYIHGPKPELYDMDTDPSERNNLIETEPATAGRLREQLRALLHGVVPVASHQEAAISPEEEARLRSLGYTGGTNGEFRSVLEGDPVAIMAGASFGLVDPKDKVRSMEMTNRILMTYGTGELQATVELARNFLAEEPKSSAVRQILADAYRGLKRYDEALSEYRTILSENPQDVRMLVDSGRVLAEKGDVPGAKTAYERALSVHPNHTPALSSLGDIYYAEGDFERAEQYYRQILQDRPAHWNSLVAVATILRERGDNHSAKEFFRRAIEVRPDDLDSYLELAWVQFIDGERDASLATLATAAGRFPDEPRIHLSRGDVLFAMGRLEEAERSYRSSLRLAPQAVEGHLGLGRIAARRGSMGEARRLFEQALAINPSHGPALEELHKLDAGESRRRLGKAQTP